MWHTYLSNKDMKVSNSTSSVFLNCWEISFSCNKNSERNGILNASLIEKCLYIYTGVSIQRPERGAQLLGGDVAVTVLQQSLIIIIVTNMNAGVKIPCQTNWTLPSPSPAENEYDNGVKNRAGNEGSRSLSTVDNVKSGRDCETFVDLRYHTLSALS